MSFFSKRKRIIKKAVKLTAAAIKDKAPQVYMHFFYGAFDIDPKNLVVWFLFKTDNELTKAKQYPDFIIWILRKLLTRVLMMKMLSSLFRKQSW